LVNDEESACGPGAGKLSLRETEVLRLVGQGLSNRKIARELDISEKTVKNHLSAVFCKVGVAGRTQAALYALHAGIERHDPVSVAEFSRVHSRHRMD
jgi:DNA-binding NarL/FixJ family response regulator